MMIYVERGEPFDKLRTRGEILIYQYSDICVSLIYVEKTADYE